MDIRVIFVLALLLIIVAKRAVRVRKEHARERKLNLLKEAKQTLETIDTTHSVSEFIRCCSHYNELANNESQIIGSDYRLISDDEEYRLLLRNTIERQCNDTLKAIRTTYKNSNALKENAYTRFCREIDPYYNIFDEETQQFVKKCKLEIQYALNGSSRAPSFHNDAADYERSLLTPSLRYEILRRDGFRCKICGRSSVEDGVKLQVDHIKPVSKGGRTTPENLRTLCQDCNLGKSDSYDEDGYN